MKAGEVWYRKTDNAPVTILAAIDLLVVVKHRKGVIDEMELSEFKEEYSDSEIVPVISEEFMVPKEYWHILNNWSNIGIFIKWISDNFESKHEDYGFGLSRKSDGEWFYLDSALLDFLDAFIKENNEHIQIQR